MGARFSKRLGAYIIDVIVISIIFGVIIMLLPESKNVIVLESELTVLNEQYLKHDIDLSVYYNRYATIIHSLDKENIPHLIINIFLILIYFVLVPFYCNGKTIGKRIFKLKISKGQERLGLNDLLLRTLIINGVGTSLISLCFIYLLPEISYFILSIICGFVQILLVIISGFMVIYRHDKKGVQDFVSGTQVVEG